MSRRMIDTPLATGVRVVDGMMTLAEGQRMGIFRAGGRRQEHAARHVRARRAMRCDRDRADRRAPAAKCASSSS